jgi:hypothetical protein
VRGGRLVWSESFGVADRATNRAVTSTTMLLRIADIVAECMVVLTVTFFLGTWFSTLTAGVVALGLQGIAFMGRWLEQVSGFSQSAHIVSLGVVSSLIMPTESLWRRAAFEMQTPLAGSLSFSPFANVSIPSVTALVYAAVFAVCVGVGALWRMSERDL